MTPEDLAHAAKATVLTSLASVTKGHLQVADDVYDVVLTGARKIYCLKCGRSSPCENYGPGCP